MKKLISIYLLLLVLLPICAQHETTSRIMSYNIRNAKGMDNKTDYERIARIIKATAPEVVALQELDSVTQRNMGVDVLKELAELTGMYSIYAPAISFQGGKYGIGILSSKQPLSWQNVPLPGREEARTLLMVEFDNLILFATHFSLNAEDRLASVAIINNLASLFIKPVFLVGDLNATPDADEINTLTKNWQILDDTKAYTFPSEKPREKIDYIMGYTAKGTTFAVEEARVLNEAVASDHRPLYVDVRWK